MLAPKALVNEIRSLYKKNKKAEAARKAAEEQEDTADPEKPKAASPRPQLEMSFDYHDISIHHEVYTVLCYAVECGAVSTEEKVPTCVSPLVAHRLTCHVLHFTQEMVAELWCGFLGPFFGLPAKMFQQKKDATETKAMDVEDPAVRYAIIFFCLWPCDTHLLLHRTLRKTAPLKVSSVRVREDERSSDPHRRGLLIPKRRRMLKPSRGNVCQ